MRQVQLLRIEDSDGVLYATGLVGHFQRMADRLDPHLVVIARCADRGCFAHQQSLGFAAAVMINPGYLSSW